MILKLANKKGWFDEINERKIHSGNIPRLGGVGIFWSFAITIFSVSWFFIREMDQMPWGMTFWAICLSLLGIHLIGLVDDFKDLRARYRFLAQFGFAILVVCLGFRFQTVYVPFLEINFELGWVSYPLTVLWIVGITNAVNMIDGLDGLCGGVSIIAAFAYAIVFLVRGDMFPALVAFTLVGSLAGYLFYNYPPARIFMGDSGSMFLGFSLAVLPLLGCFSDGKEVSIWIAITVMLVPIFDTFAAMIRRRKQGMSVFSPDRFHLHHKMLNAGFAPHQILAIVYGSCLFLDVIAISSFYMDPFWSWTVMAVVWLLFLALFLVLHYLKENEIKVIRK